MFRHLLACSSIVLAFACGGIQTTDDDVPESAPPPRTEDNGPRSGRRSDGAVKIVTCSVDAPATHLVVPQARVAEVIAQPAVLASCASCLKLTLTASSHVPIDADDYAISLRHESSVSAALAIH